MNPSVRLTSAPVGLDYAQNRYYASSLGRFTTPDPLQSSATPNDPRSWNRYAYVGGDPVNMSDPRGLYWALDCGDGWIGDASLSGPCCPPAGNGFLPNPSVDPACYSGGGGGVGGSAPSPPCWQDVGNISQTLNDLGQNILEIAKGAISNPVELASLRSLIHQDIGSENHALTTGVSSGTRPGGPDYVGGHFNLVVQQADLLNVFNGNSSDPGYLAFLGAFGGNRQDAVYGNPAQGNYTLHSSEVGQDYFHFHFDIYNPYSDYGLGLVKHFFGDVMGGHIGTPCLDPAWAR